MILTVLIIGLVVGFLLLAVISSGQQTKQMKSQTRKPTGKMSQSVIKNRWNIILSLQKEGGNGLRQSIIEADKLLDYVLKGQGFPGDTMAERLGAAGRKIKNKNAVWSAHKLRNAIAHDVGFDLVPSQVRGAIKDYERAIRDLGGEI